MSDGLRPWGMSTDRGAPQPARPRPSVGHRLLGGPPLAVALRLVFVSLVVGVVMMWLGIEPVDVVRGVVRAIERVWAMGFEAFGQLGRYFVAGAAIVVPLWLVSRLLSIKGPR